MPRPWSEETDDVPGFRVQENPMAPFGEVTVSPGNESAYPAFPDGGLGGESVGFEPGGVGSTWGKMMPDGNLGNERTFPGQQRLYPFFSERFTLPAPGSGTFPPSPQSVDISRLEVGGFRVGHEDTPGSNLAGDSMPTFGEGFDRPPYGDRPAGQTPFDESSSTGFQKFVPGSGDPGAASGRDGNPYWVSGAGNNSANPAMPVRYGFPVDQLADAKPTVGSSVSRLPVPYNPDGGPPPRSLRPGDPQKEDRFDGEIVVLPDGSAIKDEGSPTGYLLAPPSKPDLRDVAAKGRRIGEAYRAALANPETSAGALPYLALQLGLDLGHAGTYDYQRSGNRITGYTQYPRFFPIANVNVGLLGQQAGLPLEDLLTIAGRFAALFSSNADPNAPYGLDPKTLHYIKRGYEIGQTGVFDPPAAR